MKRIKVNVPKIFKALASEKRLRIFKLLLKHKQELYPNLISEKLGIPFQTISRHILKLRSAGLLNSRREKNKMFYIVVIPKDNFIKNLIKLVRRCKV